MTGLRTATRRRRGGGIDRDTRQATLTFLRRQTTFDDLDLARLDDDEQVDLCALIHKATVDIAHGSNFSRLSAKESRRYETLVERAAGAPGAFAAERDAAALRDKARALARRARAAVPKAERERAFLTEVTSHVQQGFLHLDMVAVLVFVVGQILAGEATSPGATLDGAGDELTLCLDRRFGLGANFDPDGTVTPRLGPALDHLATNRWLLVEKRGHELRAQLGTRTLGLLR